MVEFILNNAKEVIKPQMITGKDIIEIGSLNVNGSVKDDIVLHSPSKYIGIDMRAGNYVDLVINSNDLLNHFPKESFDLVISTEMLEHCEDWKLAIHNIKSLVKTFGYVYITTCNKRAGRHAYPDDFWRFELHDLAFIFSDFIDLQLYTNTGFNTVIVLAKKPTNWTEVDLSNINLFKVE